MKFDYIKLSISCAYFYFLIIMAMLVLKDKEFMISEVYFNFKNTKEWDKRVPTTERQVNMRYIDYGKVSWYSITLETLKKDPNFAKLNEDQIKEKLLGRTLKMSVSLLD